MSAGSIGRLTLACSLLGLLLAGVCARMLSADASPRDILLGWALGVGNGLGGLLLRRRARGGDMGRFFRWSVGGNAVRFLVCVAVLIVAGFVNRDGFEALAIAAVAGSLVFMAGDVWDLMGSG